MKLTPGVDTVVGVLPFFHAFGLVVAMFPGLYDGAKVVTLPLFEPGSFLHTVKYHKVRTSSYSLYSYCRIQ